MTSPGNLSGRLSNAQRIMLKTLEEDGPFDVFQMNVYFGRKWLQVWGNLKEQGYVEFALYAKGAKHYRVR